MEKMIGCGSFISTQSTAKECTEKKPVAREVITYLAAVDEMLEHVSPEKLIRIQRFVSDEYKKNPKITNEKLVKKVSKQFNIDLK